MLDLLQSIMYEKMYDELRTKQQLGYYVDCTKKKTVGVYGISFIIQSAKHSPVFLETKILEFIDNFYHDMLTEESFENFKKGLLNRKKAGFNGIEDEGKDLYTRLTHFSLDPSREIGWNDRLEEIEFIEKLQFNTVVQFYKNLFAP